ncbi:unnamed protein product [Linum trigynum]|uniref:Thiamine pyrophosphate enzyme central domain-containing protein n=1 Tax=Linum trigynum TaxID=586398 RepID=A0AAV2FHM7_9ROSI
MGLGSFPCDHDLSLQMLGIHGAMYANYAIDNVDLLLAFGVRFDDLITGKVETFGSRATIVHIDIDSAEIGKNKQPHIAMCADSKPAVQCLNSVLEKKGSQFNLDFTSAAVPASRQLRRCG